MCGCVQKTGKILFNIARNMSCGWGLLHPSGDPVKVLASAPKGSLRLPINAELVLRQHSNLKIRLLQKYT